MSDSNSIHLSEKDFLMIAQALDKLLVRNDTKDLFFDAFTDVILKDQPAALHKFEQERAKRREAEIKSMQLLTDDVRLLQAKLITLKRLLVEKANLNEVDSILNYTK
jgi:hypothetical protein